MPTVLTLNLWNENGPLRRRMDHLGGWLLEHHPDVVALQEVGDVGGPSGPATQAEVLADAAGYPDLLQELRPRGAARREGLAILTDGVLAPFPSVELPEVEGDHPRFVLGADVTLGTWSVRLAVTHLAWRLEHRAGRVRQADAIARSLGSATGRTVLAADLNDVAGSPVLAALETAGLRDAYAAVGGEERATFAEDNPYTTEPELTGRRIDHVLVGSEIEVQAPGSCSTARTAPSSPTTTGSSSPSRDRPVLPGDTGPTT